MRCIRWKVCDGPNSGLMGLWLAVMQLGWQANSLMNPAGIAAAIPGIQDVTDAYQMIVNVHLIYC